MSSSAMSPLGSSSSSPPLRGRPLRSCRERAISAAGLGVYRPTCASLLPCTEWILKHPTHQGQTAWKEEKADVLGTGNELGAEKGAVEKPVREEKEILECSLCCRQDLQEGVREDVDQGRKQRGADASAKAVFKEEGTAVGQQGSKEGPGLGAEDEEDTRRVPSGAGGRGEGHTQVCGNGSFASCPDPSLKSSFFGESVPAREFENAEEQLVSQDSTDHPPVRTSDGPRAPHCADPRKSACSSKGSSSLSCPSGPSAVSLPARGPPSPPPPPPPYPSSLFPSGSAPVPPSSSRVSHGSACIPRSTTSSAVPSPRSISSSQSTLSPSCAPPEDACSSPCVALSSSASTSSPRHSSKVALPSPPPRSSVAVAQISRLSQSSGAWPSMLLDALEHAKAWSRFYLYHADSHAPFNSFDSRQAVMLLFRLLPCFSLSEGEVMVEVGHGSCPLIPFIWDRVTNNAFKKCKPREEATTKTGGESGVLFSLADTEAEQKAKGEMKKVPSFNDVCEGVFASRDSLPLPAATPGDGPPSADPVHEERTGRKRRLRARDMENHAFSSGLYVGVESCREAAEAALRMHDHSRLARRRGTTCRGINGLTLSRETGFRAAPAPCPSEQMRDENNLVNELEGESKVRDSHGQYLRGTSTETDSTEADNRGGVSSVLRERSRQHEIHRQDATSDSGIDGPALGPNFGGGSRAEGEVLCNSSRSDRPELLVGGLLNAGGREDSCGDIRGSLKEEKVEEGDREDESFSGPSKRGSRGRNRVARSTSIAGLTDNKWASTLRRMLRLGCLEFAVCTDGFNYVDEQGKVHLEKICLDESPSSAIYRRQEAEQGTTPCGASVSERSDEPRIQEEEKGESEAGSQLPQEDVNIHGHIRLLPHAKPVSSASDTLEDAEPSTAAGTAWTSLPSSSCSSPVSPSCSSSASLGECSMPDAGGKGQRERQMNGPVVLSSPPVPQDSTAFFPPSSCPTLLTGGKGSTLPCSPAATLPVSACLQGAALCAPAGAPPGPPSTGPDDGSPSTSADATVTRSVPCASLPSPSPCPLSDPPASLTTSPRPLASVSCGSVKYVVLKSTLDSICVMLPCTGTLNWDEDLRIPRSLVVWFDSFARLLKSPRKHSPTGSALGFSTKSSCDTRDMRKSTSGETKPVGDPSSGSPATASHGESGSFPSIKEETGPLQACRAAQGGQRLCLASRKRSRMGGETEDENSSGEGARETWGDAPVTVPTEKRNEEQGERISHGTEKKQKKGKVKGVNEERGGDPSSSKSFVIFLEPRNKARIHLLTIIKVIHSATFTSQPSPARHLRLCRIFCSRARGREKAVGYLLEKRDLVYTSYSELYDDVVEVTKVLRKLDPYGEFDDILPPFEPPKWRSEKPEDIEILVDYVWSEPTAEKVRKRTGAVGGGLVCLGAGTREDNPQDISEALEGKDRQSASTRGKGRGGRGRRCGTKSDGSKQVEKLRETTVGPREQSLSS